MACHDYCAFDKANDGLDEVGVAGDGLAAVAADSVAGSDSVADSVADGVRRVADHSGYVADH